MPVALVSVRGIHTREKESKFPSASGSFQADRVVLIHLRQIRPEFPVTSLADEIVHLPGFEILNPHPGLKGNGIPETKANIRRPAALLILYHEKAIRSLEEPRFVLYRKFRVSGRPRPFLIIRSPSLFSLPFARLGGTVEFPL